MEVWKHNGLGSLAWGKLAGGRNETGAILRCRAALSPRRERGGIIVRLDRHHVEHALCLRSHVAQCKNVTGPRLGATSESV